MTGPVAGPKTVPSGKRSCTPQRRAARRINTLAAVILSGDAMAGPTATRGEGSVRGWSWVTSAPEANGKLTLLAPPRQPVGLVRFRRARLTTAARTVGLAAPRPPLLDDANRCLDPKVRPRSRRHPVAHRAQGPGEAPRPDRTNRTPRS